MPSRQFKSTFKTRELVLPEDANIIPVLRNIFVEAFTHSYQKQKIFEGAGPQLMAYLTESFKKTGLLLYLTSNHLSTISNSASSEGTNETTYSGTFYAPSRPLVSFSVPSLNPHPLLLFLSLVSIPFLFLSFFSHSPLSTEEDFVKVDPNEKSHLIVCFLDDAPIGFAELHHPKLPFPGAYIAQLAVHPLWKAHGFGRILLEKARKCIQNEVRRGVGGASRRGGGEQEGGGELI